MMPKIKSVKLKQIVKLWSLKQMQFLLLSVINPEVQVKPFALDEIQQQANNQKSKINNNSEVTKEEKDAAILLVDDLIKQSEVRLDAATKTNKLKILKMILLIKF